MEELTEFIAKHSWLVNFKVTDFFIDRVWENAPPEVTDYGILHFADSGLQGLTLKKMLSDGRLTLPEKYFITLSALALQLLHISYLWLDMMKTWSVEDLTNVPFGKQKKHWPESLKGYISSCLKYSIPRETDLVQIESILSSSSSKRNESGQHMKDENCEQNFDFPYSTFTSSVQNSLYCPDQECVPPTSISKHSVCISERVIDSEGKSSASSKHEPLPQISELSFCAGERKIDVERKLSVSSGHKHALLPRKSGDLFGISESQIDSNIRKGMTAKKLHEVRNMSALINAVVSKSGADCVVDVGSGLGYLGQVLHSVFHHHVLGLEGKQSHTSGAERRTVQKNTNLCSSLQNRTCELYENQGSEAEFLQVLSHWLSTLPPDGARVCSCKSAAQSSSPDGMRVTKKPGITSHQSDLTGSNTNQERCCDISVENSAQYSNFMKEGGEHMSQNGNRYKVVAANNVCNNETIQTFKQEYCCITQDPKTSAFTCSYNYPSPHVNGNSTVKNSFEPHQTVKDVFVTNKTVTDGSGPYKTEKTVLVPKKTENTGLVPNKTEKTGLVSHSTVKNGSVPNKTVKNNSVPNNGVKTGLVQNKNIQLPSITSNICMVGLHCCGDLSPTMLRYFAQMDFIKSLCIVSCCYHRMEYNKDQFTFTKFPLSSHMKLCVSKAESLYPAFHFTPFSMRLAAQETRARWKQQTKHDHDFHTRNVAYRGILELCLTQGSFTLKKMSRKMVHKGDCESFETYVKSVSKHINIPSSVSTEHYLKSFQEKMWELYQENESYFVYVEPITALQFLLQPVLETMIYKDRLLWLEEHGFHGTIVPVFDELISPRNLALIATKCQLNRNY